jgi:integrase
MLAEILGHADMRITKKHYAHLFDRALKNAVRNMPNFGYQQRSRVQSIR